MRKGLHIIRALYPEVWLAFPEQPHIVLMIPTEEAGRYTMQHQPLTHDIFQSTDANGVRRVELLLALSLAPNRAQSLAEEITNMLEPHLRYARAAGYLRDD